jgi:hypothetical protein
MMIAKHTPLAAALVLLAALSSSGCHQLSVARRLYQPPPSPVPLGTTIDQIWQMQERSAEASDFVVYQHEFQMDSSELNESGKNHVMEIAYRLQQGQQFPVVIEQSNMSPREGTEFEYPVHLNPALDMERRTAIATALGRLGIADAADRVVVAPAYAPGQQAGEAISAYQRGVRNFGGFGGLGGGFFGGLGGGGGFGGLGGFGGGGFF